MTVLEDIALGQTVRMKDGRTGVVRFVGLTRFAAGDWIGVELEDDSGKNDGSVMGERYFDCAMGHGIFSRAEPLTVVAQPAPKPAAAKKVGGRPSSMFTGGTARANAGSDPGLGKRMSLNAPSPSPVPRVSRPSSITRSPTRSPTKQLATAFSSTSNSRTGTPSNVRVASAGFKSTRPSMGTTRPSMGPPALPPTRTARQPSVSSTTSKTNAPPTRPLSGRLSMAPGRVVSRPEALRNMSSGSVPGRENGAASRGSTQRVASPRKSDDEILSPQPRSPVQARTMALERMTSDSPITNTRPPATRTTTASTTTTATGRPAGGNTAAAREIQDLKTKLRILEGKAIENKEKLAQTNKIQADRDRFEGIIQKLQVKVQPLQQEVGEMRKENAELKAQLDEAESRFRSIEEMQADYDSALELATLDREVAEETADVLKHEFETLKEKYEEVEAELDLLREENDELSNGLRPEEKASAGWINQERQNERLKEALFALRDITQQQEEEFKEQIKSLEEDLAGFESLQEQHTATTEKLAQAEATVEDLRQQLDTALGAEDMIEDLTERNMSQSEQIEELKAVIEDLENLKEINDELEINHVQNEKEMQDELDFKDSVIAEQARRAAQQEETLGDMEYTLSRFRELVTSLQTDLEDMRASHAVTETESEQLNSKSRAMMDLNMKLQISAAKAQVKAIDLELRRLEAQEHEQHLEIVKLFLPDSYTTDRDSVLALLRFKRLAFKANLLNGFIKERVGQPQPGHEDDVFAGCEAIDKLTWVAAMCDRFVNSISHCSLEHFAKYEGALYELEPVERALNGWIDGLRRDELKETQCATELQRTMALMSHLSEVHIANDLESYAEDIHMRAALMQSHLESAAVTFTTLRNMVQRVVPAGEDDELAQYFSRKAETVINQTRSTKVIAGKTVRALEDLKNRSLSLTPDTMEAFEQAESVSQEIVILAQKIGLDLHQLLHEEGRTEPYTYTDIQTCVHRTATTAAGVSESDLFSAYLTKLRILTSQISDLSALAADLTQTQEFERSPAPWLRRSQEIQALKTIPVDAEEELRHLKEEYNESQRTINMHKENLSIAHLKIETLESRMRDANAKTSRITELEAQIEHTRSQIASLKEDIEKQDRELKNLEGDRDKWKKVASDSSRLMAGAVESGAGNKAGQERAVATAREMEALKTEISSLQSSVRYLRDDNRRARVTEQAGYEWLSEPLVPKKTNPVEARKALVASEGRDALGELVKLVSGAKVYDLSTLPADRLAWRPARTSPGYHASIQAEEYAAWKEWEGNILRKSKGLSGGQDKGDVGRSARRAVARLQIRLPGGDGKMIPGVRRGGVEIVGSREWESRVGAVM